jgi:hypothetical protein
MSLALDDRVGLFTTGENKQKNENLTSHTIKNDDSKTP